MAAIAGYRQLSPTWGEPALDIADIIMVTIVAKYWTNDTRRNDI